MGKFKDKTERLIGNSIEHSMKITASSKWYGRTARKIGLDKIIGRVAKREAKKINKRVWRYITLSIILLVISIATTLCLITISNNMITNSIIGNAYMLLFHDKEKEENKYDPGYTEYIPTVDVGTNEPGADPGTVFNGLYPSDPELRRKAEFLELANEIADRFDKMTPQMIFGIAWVENSLSLDFTKATDSIYKDLETIGETDSRFFDSSGKVLVNGVGESAKCVHDGDHKALGTFQFWCKGINGESSQSYNSKAMTGGEAKVNVVGFATKNDDSLGFKRPNPFFLPDAMFNATRVVEGHMLTGHGMKKNMHKTLVVKDPRWASLPQKIQDEIYYMYAVDRYHGDMNAKSEELHAAYVTFFIDIYQTYGSLDFMQCDKKDQRYVVAGSDWRNDNVYTGKLKNAITIGGKTFNQSLVNQMDAKYGRKYTKLLGSIHNGENTNNRAGIFYGLEALNGGTYYYNLWSKQVKEALIKEGKLDSNGNPIGATTGNVTVPDLKGGGIPGVVFPVAPINGYNLDITSQFGWRELGGEVNEHQAIDINTNGQKVNCMSALPGKVAQIGHNSSPFTNYGNVVRVTSNIVDADGNKQVINIQYNHLSSISVKEGDTVTAGQVIGKVGGTPDFKVHLDMEVELNSTPRSSGDKKLRNLINPFTIYGYDSSWDRNTRNAWLDLVNIHINCTETCKNSYYLEKNRVSNRYYTFNCKQHRNIADKYPR